MTRREALVRAPAGVVERVVVFRDHVGTEGRRGVSAEADACRFYLEHRPGPQRRSPSIPSEQPPARALHGVDFEGTCQLIERCIEAALPREWRAVVVVALGWHLSARQVREGPWLRRAGYEGAVPRGWSSSSLDRRAADLRAELVARGLIDRETAAAVAAVEEGAMLVTGWKAIGDHLGVSEATARRWRRERGLPVRQPIPGGAVIAYVADLDEWLRTDRTCTPMTAHAR